MTAEIATIRTAAEAAAALRTASSADLAQLDPRTLIAVTDLLRAAAELARAQRPIVLHGPEIYAPATAPGTAVYGAHARTPPPSPRDESRDETPRPWRATLWGDKAIWFGSGATATGMVGALVATVAGAAWVLVLSAIGAVLWPVGAASVNRAERRGERP